MALQLSSLMSDLLCLQLRPRSIEATYPYAVMPHALLYNFMLSEKEGQKMLLQRLWLAAALVPWRHATYKLKKRELSIEDVQHVSSLYAAADVISMPSLDKFSLPNETTALALLFRDPVVSQGHSVGSCEVGDVIKQYNTLMYKVQELDIEQLVTQKCLINGRDLANLLQENGYKAGPSTAVLLQRCLVWQFNHLTGTKEACETWLLDNWREIID
ncbi:hypothetical protein PILCRDRAFT_84278 [Piloderma croceum F 1598]|uniref:Uncharacterized protein n=1 Tax=Piloderma croceum (strain F 1598) TaxID=765440 RepID=A0A0C3GEM1_PILCF|nr:hypothetical protein PILCRDRAFT_84278 [Piloderma croceum F 1598]